MEKRSCFSPIFSDNDWANIANFISAIKQDAMPRESRKVALFCRIDIIADTFRGDFTGEEEIMKKPEILAPAGDFEKLQMAVAYGADAVYVGGKQFSLRANAKNFDDEELRQGIAYAHDHGVKVYVGVNIFANNEDIKGLDFYLRTLKDIGADAVIVADPGVFDVARKIKDLEIHISTQANVTNYQGVSFYRDLGASRVILARELSFMEIREINDKLPQFETEIFVHGAMCVSYSGRCLLSNYLIGRDANKGDCAQPCRWGYYLNEEQRPGEYLPVYEDERGTFILNSKDMCMIGHMPELVATGAVSFKIEGRMKSSYYVASVTKAYRQALDDFFISEHLYESKKDYYLEELKKTGVRDFFTGFYLGRPTTGQSIFSAANANNQDFLGVVVDYDVKAQTAIVEQRNRFDEGDRVEFLKSGVRQIVKEMRDIEHKPVNSALHPKQLIRIKTEKPVEKFDIMRKGV